MSFVKGGGDGLHGMRLVSEDILLWTTRQLREGDYLNAVVCAQDFFVAVATRGDLLLG